MQQLHRFAPGQVRQLKGQATHNATPDDIGYSPHEKVFGRQKPSMGIALPTDSLAEDISQFLNACVNTTVI